MFMLSDHGSESDPVSRRILGDIQPVHERLPADSRVRISVRGAHHFSFGDQALLKSQLLLRLLGRLEARRGLAITADDVRRFFEANLEARPDALPPGRAPLSPEVEIGHAGGTSPNTGSTTSRWTPRTDRAAERPDPADAVCAILLAGARPSPPIPVSGRTHGTSHIEP